MLTMLFYAFLFSPLSTMKFYAAVLSPHQEALLRIVKWAKKMDVRPCGDARQQHFEEMEFIRPSSAKGETKK